MSKELSFFDTRLEGIFGSGYEVRVKNNIQDINFNLLYHQYPRYDEANSFQFYQRDSDNSTRDKWLLGNKPSSEDNYEFFDENTVGKVASRHFSNIKKLLGQNSYTELDLEQDWRMVVGLGNESVYEVGITLHHIYGFPYIPGTAIKGVCNHYAKESGIDKEVRHKIFGVDEKDAHDKRTKRGAIIFFDAYPTSKITLSPDIMNNHYPDYYDGAKKPPADWQSPNPIFFLTVKNTKFRFILGIRDSANEELLDQAKKILQNALSENGIGAKTMVGYGAMAVKEGGDNDEENIIDCEVKLPVKPKFLNEKISKFNPKRRYIMQGIVTKSGRTNYMKVYIKEGNIQENVRVDVARAPLGKGTVIEVEVQVNKKQRVTQASLKNIIK